MHAHSSATPSHASLPTSPTAESAAAARTETLAAKIPTEVPRLRGTLHTWSAPVAAVLGGLLLVFASSAKEVFAITLYTASSVLLFGMSALYHRVQWGTRTKAVLRRIDHANIFLLIAGTYTPIALLGLPGEKGWILFWLVWGVAALGIVFNVAWIGAPRWLYLALYLGTGWIAVMYLVDLLHASIAMMVLVAVGGLIYTLGAVFYGIKRPNPWPRHFGFHEIFHAHTVAAWACHWVAILLIVLNPIGV